MRSIDCARSVMVCVNVAALVNSVVEYKIAMVQSVFSRILSLDAGDFLKNAFLDVEWSFIFYSLHWILLE
jgi:hypothetical protein